MRVRTEPNPDLVCFLAQQCIEKYLRARLQEAGVPFDRTHNLTTLLGALSTVEPGWTELRPALAPLSAYAVAFRYPGRSATNRQAREALGQAREMRRLARKSLRLPATRMQRLVKSRRRPQTSRGRAGK